MRALLATAVLVVGLLAGCTGSDPEPSPADDADFSDLGLQADAQTGVIRGVVIDEAIRPLAGVAIALTGAVARDATTTDAGLFGFSNLAPGTYFVSASKPGFLPVQQSVEVQAGVEEPPITKILLPADATTAPFAQTYVFDGFLECSFSFVAVGFAACSNAAFPNDKFSVTYELDRTPQYLQSEMAWASTQAVSDELDLVYSASGDGALLTNWAETQGPSPLVLQANQTLAAQWGIGNGTGLFIRVFNEPIPGTQPSDPVQGDDCVDRPGLGGCLTGLGFTASQRFTILTTAFYGYEPPADWRYAETGPYPPPA